MHLSGITSTDRSCSCSPAASPNPVGRWPAADWIHLIYLFRWFCRSWTAASRPALVVSVKWTWPIPLWRRLFPSWCRMATVWLGSQPTPAAGSSSKTPTPQTAEWESWWRTTRFATDAWPMGLASIPRPACSMCCAGWSLMDTGSATLIFPPAPKP